MKDYKTKRKLFKTQEVIAYDKAKIIKPIQESLDELGYRKESQYTDCISHLAW